ncbi:formylglycine-generating enzyme family protein [Methanolobus profundi]|uniref:Formylglycine-generating enzyme, required for sulfatase activity, contains SUMF1/FGE domain n=1 Tax=Methanolobus profundi TaxID=487685 RepID=A0A1I4PN57_9EURY|nr:formylglycine-generating enzyme family protein [Methanolobus profundi]SFM29104.1 Formylglycine-generating enzyme, required for sulfatase activity, contains SUMF1/FGE domain [Methanolobus profundi]
MNGTAASFKNSIGMEFMLIPAGCFRLDQNMFSYEIPEPVVTIPEPFYIGKYPVTQKEWKAVMGDLPSCFEGNDRPVECISWDDVQKFIRELNAKEDNGIYRLPSEAEWEYACRAGTDTKYFFGDSDAELGTYAWYYGNSEHNTHPVGRKRPNPWGLYDMHGNVWEWCQNRHHRNYEEALAEGTAWDTVGSIGIVLRGGGWVSYPDKCCSSCRSSYDSDYGSYSLGFRLLRSV